MNHRQSRQAIKEAMDLRPWKWLARELGYASTDYVVQMLNGVQPAPSGLYEDIAALLRVHVRSITPDHPVHTFARPSARGSRAVAR